MLKNITLPICLFFITLSQTAQANIEIDFREGAPKDRFIIKNIGQCEFNDLEVTIDLSNSDGKLIFDTTASGAGVEVFQPFEVTEGNMQLANDSVIFDGSNKIKLNISNLAPQKVASFTIDVDDTLTNSELGNIRVSNSEINNSQVIVKIDDSSSSNSSFGVDSKAMITLASCKT